MGFFQSHKIAAGSPAPQSFWPHSASQESYSWRHAGAQRGLGPGAPFSSSPAADLWNRAHARFCALVSPSVQGGLSLDVGLQRSFSSNALGVRRWLIFVSEVLSHVPALPPVVCELPALPPPAQWVNSTFTWGKPFIFLDSRRWMPMIRSRSFGL